MHVKKLQHCFSCWVRQFLKCYPLHPQQYSPLLKAFTSQGSSELTLLLKIQEYCYDNIHFMKAFQKIVVLLYKGMFVSSREAYCGLFVYKCCIDWWDFYLFILKSIYIAISQRMS